MKRWLPLCLLVTACAGELNEDIPVVRPGDAAAADGGKTNNGFGNADSGPISEAAVFTDAAPSLDAFFINDPPPPMCAADGAMSSPVAPGGTVECPDDKNREGCACTKVGEKRACWPGRRLNRNHGQCKDGVTTCVDTTEFGMVWGPCQGYVLPTEGAIAGPAACRCFSESTWAIANLKPCLTSSGGNMQMYSSHEVAGGGVPVCETLPAGNSAPSEPWTTSTLVSDCIGHFKLCYAIKAGKYADPKPTDCTVHEACVDVTYDTVGEKLTLPTLPGWRGNDFACNKRFADEGGYGEMSALGMSAECDVVDDGMGGPYVFFRTTYCRPGEMCGTGGSGTFGN